MATNRTTNYKKISNTFQFIRTARRLLVRIPSVRRSLTFCIKLWTRGSSKGLFPSSACSDMLKADTKSMTNGVKAVENALKTYTNDSYAARWSSAPVCSRRVKSIWKDKVAIYSKKKKGPRISFCRNNAYAHEHASELCSKKRITFQENSHKKANEGFKQSSLFSWRHHDEIEETILIEIICQQENKEIKRTCNSIPHPNKQNDRAKNENNRSKARQVKQKWPKAFSGTMGIINYKVRRRDHEKIKGQKKKRCHNGGE